VAAIFAGDMARLPMPVTMTRPGALAIVLHGLLESRAEALRPGRSQCRFQGRETLPGDIEGSQGGGDGGCEAYSCPLLTSASGHCTPTPDAPVERAGPSANRARGIVG